MAVLCQTCDLQNFLPVFNLTFHPLHMFFHRWKNFNFVGVLFVNFPFYGSCFWCCGEEVCGQLSGCKNLYPPLDSSNTTPVERGRDTSLLPGGHWSPGFPHGLRWHCKGQMSLPPSDNEPYFPDTMPAPFPYSLPRGEVKGSPLSLCRREWEGATVFSSQLFAWRRTGSV